MALSGLTGFMQLQFSYNALINGPSSGITINPQAVQNTITAKRSVVLGGNVANGANEGALAILTIAPSGTATINLQTLTDFMNVASVVLIRLKSFFFWLLGTGDDSVNGTVCTGVTIGNAGSNANQLDMGAVTHTRLLTNGDWTAYGTGSAAGLTVSGTHLNILITNTDGTNAAGLMYGLFGATT